MSEVQGRATSGGGPNIILASASPTRARLLQGAGVEFRVAPAAVDEAPIKIALAAEGAAAQRVAEVLAECKALDVSGRFPLDLVIGADQVLACKNALFDKPADRTAARGQLQALRGCDHELVTAACVARGGAVIWRDLREAHLTMRRFSDSFLDLYLDSAGPELTGSVGAYALEGRGAQLFSRVDGDFFTILGLPLLPLLECLRRNGALVS